MLEVIPDLFTSGETTQKMEAPLCCLSDTLGPDPSLLAGGDSLSEELRFSGLCR